MAISGTSAKMIGFCACAASLVIKTDSMKGAKLKVIFFMPVFISPVQKTTL
jgi:hypothetical protein